MKVFTYSILMIVSIASCQTIEPEEPTKTSKKTEANEPISWIIPTGKTVETRFNSPEGFTRTSLGSNSFGLSLRNLPLKADGAEVLKFDGTVKSNYQTYLAVVDLPIGTKNLHQCADAIMRLRAEYLFSQDKFNEISFRQASGKTLFYSTWLAGKTPDKTNLWTYLETVFNTCNTTSLKQQLVSKPLETLAIGDVFITGPPPGLPFGHAIIVVDKCADKAGKVKFMLAQSYMPAQEIQILDNPSNPGCPWYDLDFGTTLHTPQWDFTPSQLKSFE